MADMIDRQAAIDAIEKHIRTAEEPYVLERADKVMNHAFEIAASCVYNLPSVDAVPVVRGRWMLRKADSGFHTDCVCSECKRRFAMGWNFCPNCGARMDSEQNG